MARVSWEQIRNNRILGVTGLLLIGLLVFGTGVWGTLAVYFTLPALNKLAAGVYGLVAIAALAGLAFQRWRWRAFLAYLSLFAVLMLWWSFLEPSNDRDWQSDVAILPYAVINGDLVTVHNIRNFNYRSETDYDPFYYDKTFDLRRLESADVFASYWAGPDIAHIFLSFGFGGGDYLSVSIETRKELGESYSTLGGFFRQYELFYVVADERDVVRLRTNVREDPPEDVYLYRVEGPMENGQRLFLEYMKKINSLRENPEFYNTLTTNCTTTIWLNAKVNPGRLPFSWKILLSGHLPEYLYETGRLDTRLPFHEMKKAHYITEVAKRYNDDPDFSQKIRSHLP